MKKRKRPQPPSALIPWGLALLALIPGLAWALFGNLNALVSRGFLIEDSFYYFSLSRNLVQGRGFSLDGLQASSGFHPLHLLSLLPGAWLLDQDSFLRYALVLGALSQAFTVWLLWKLGLKLYGRAGAVAASALWALALGPRLLHMNGMETGLSLSCLLLSSLLYLKARDASFSSGGDWFRVGLALGLAILARADNMVLLPALALDLLWRNGGRSRRSVLFLTAGGLALILPWMALSRLATGSALPDSGPASRFLALETGQDWLNQQFQESPAAVEKSWSLRPLGSRAENALAYSVQELSWHPLLSWSLGFSHFSIFGPWYSKPWASFLFARPALTALFTLAASVAFLALCASHGVFFLGAAVFSQALAYVLLPAPPWFALRYLGPFSLLSTFILTADLGRILWSRFRALALILGLGLALGSGAQYLILWPGPRNPEAYHVQALRYRELLPPGTRLGCFQAGIQSYFSGLTVVNLDGVMNREALAALQRRELGNYLRKNQVDYVADWPQLLDRIFWPRSGLVQGKDAVLVEKGFFDLWRILPSPVPPGPEPFAAPRPGGASSGLQPVNSGHG